MQIKTKHYIGIKTLPNALDIMQIGGIYWFSTPNIEDGKSLCQHIISHQTSDVCIRIIAADSPENINLYSTSNNAKTCFYALKTHPKALHKLTEDLYRIRSFRNELFILNISADLFNAFGFTELVEWMTALSKYLSENNSSLCIISEGPFARNLEKELLPLHRQLHGLISIHTYNQVTQYHVHWWANNEGITAQQTFFLEHQNEWVLIKEKSQKTIDQYIDNNKFNKIGQTELFDAHLFYANQNILDGAPPLSKYWQLFENNEQLFDAAISPQSATFIFAMTKSNMIKTLAEQIYTLRVKFGSTLKLIIREITPCLRYNDERLLLSCGANLIISHTETLSRVLTQVQSIQDTQFNRIVPDNFEKLFNGMQVAELKGFIDFMQFCVQVNGIVENPYLFEDSKGVLVAMKPVNELTPKQALSLCHFRRFGDLATFSNNQLYVFLYACRIVDVNIALMHIFRLPVTEIFINTQFWSQDKEISNTLKKLKQQHTDILYQDDSNTETAYRDVLHSNTNDLENTITRQSPIPIQLKLKIKN